MFRGRAAWIRRPSSVAASKACVSSAEQGAPVADEHFKFSRPLPDRDVDVRLEDPEGRGEIRLIEQPRQQNNYTARVSIRDPQAGAGEYSFTLVWNRASSKELKEAATIPDARGRGFLWSGTVDGRVRVTLKGGASFSEIAGRRAGDRRACRNPSALTRACRSDADDSKIARPRPGIDCRVTVGRRTITGWFLRLTIRGRAPTIMRLSWIGNDR